jgi:hypothetical protein
MADREDRIKGGHRVLEDHRDLIAADLPELFLFMPTSSSPSKTTEDPGLILPGATRICMIEAAVTDLPEPDSPTMPRILPFSRLKEIPATERTSPAGTLKEVWRFF